MNSFMYKYIGYINYLFTSFSDLELSFWLELRYSKGVFCKMSLKGPSFEFVKCYRNCHVTRFPWKPRFMDWQDLWILTFPKQTCYHGDQMSDFPPIFFFF